MRVYLDGSAFRFHRGRSASPYPTCKPKSEGCRLPAPSQPPHSRRYRVPADPSTIILSSVDLTKQVRFITIGVLLAFAVARKGACGRCLAGPKILIHILARALRGRRSQ